MDDMIESIRRKLNENSDYGIKIPVHIIPSKFNVEIEAADKVDVSFSIDMDVRSWGIRDFNVFFTETLTIPAEAIEYDENGDEKSRKDVDIKVDLRTAEVEYQEADYISLIELELTLDVNFKVTKAVMYVGYLKK